LRSKYNLLKMDRSCPKVCGICVIEQFPMALSV
jgi:hypothetical protein